MSAPSEIHFIPAKCSNENAALIVWKGSAVTGRAGLPLSSAQISINPREHAKSYMIGME
jgi:hypothetical protein